MVVDSGCMKCLDCVSVCPNEALRWGPGKPAVFAKPRRTPDIRHPKDYSMKEEFALAGVFLVSLYAVHGLYGVSPFLVSLGVASILAYVLVSVGRMAYRPTVRAARVNLRLKGRVTRAGYASIALAGVLVIFLGHSTLIQHRQWRGTTSYDELAPVRNAAIATSGASLDEAARGELSANRSYIERTMALTPFPIARHEVQQAWLSAALGEGDRFAVEALEAGAMLRSPTPYYMDVARTHARLGRRADAEKVYGLALKHAHASERAGTLAEFAEFLSQDPSRGADALARAQEAYEADRSSVPAVMALARLRAIVEGDRAGAAELIGSFEPGGALEPESLSSMVSALFELGAGDRALSLVRRVGGSVSIPGRAALVEADVLMARGETEAARAALGRVLEEERVPVPVLRGVAEVQATRLGDYDSALSTVDRAIESGRATHDLIALKGDLLTAMGRAEEAMPWYERALSRVDVERRTFPERAGLWADTGGIHARMGQFDEAASALERATELEPRNPGNWAVLANVYSENGEAAKASEARSRARSLESTGGVGSR
jgi:tetratricopeptide (TPR) repeat protein/ferredoxin